MDKVKVSIILPALNSIEYIRQCVDSILAQTLKDIELLCVDAGSTDGTLELFREYAEKDKRVRVINSDKKSYGRQVNLGMEAARGEYMGIVESDDFISPYMYESLYKLSEGGRADLVKGNFYDYFDYEGMKPIAAPNGERENMPPDGTVFKVNDYPHILQGHPSIWSGIYRMDFLRENDISFMEIPGGGWTDNPFFFETLCSAESICWTSKPFYYYRKSNPNSSSNKIPDLTLPVRRMMDNLDVVDKYDLSDEALGMVYRRAIIYLNGSVIEMPYRSQEKEIREWAIKLYKRLDERIVNEQLYGWFIDMYYNYLSPLMLNRPQAGRVFIYAYAPEDKDNKFIDSSHKIAEPENINKVKTLEQLILKLQSVRHDVDIFLVMVRNSLEPDKPYGRIEAANDHLSCQLFSYEVVNSELLTREMYDRFMELFGPFDAQYFADTKGLDEELKKAVLDKISAGRDAGKSSDAEGMNLFGPENIDGLFSRIRALPVTENISISAEEYTLMLKQNDYYHRIMENNYYADFFKYAPYKILKKGVAGVKKINGGILCCKQHGLPYTVKLFFRRGH